MRFPNKKWMICLASFLSLYVVCAPLQAQEAGAAGGEDTGLLRQIAKNTEPLPTYTTQILEYLSTLPAVLEKLGEFMLAWMSPDDSPVTASLQGNFTQLGNFLIQSQTAQIALQQQLNSALLGTKANEINYANDLVYSTMVDAPFFATDPRNAGKNPPVVDPKLNYIKNASGITLRHVFPGTWQGKPESQLSYISYYNTIMSIESFNAFVLSQQYAEGNQLNILQQTLVTQASDPQNWFAQVASENIGFVLRQILLYQSQSFVLMTQMLQLQKQQVSAQVMTNALLIANNITDETSLVAKAQGVKPDVT